MSFTFNDLNGSKSNATAACSTNSPSKSNLNTDDIAKKTGDKTNLNIDSTASVSKSDSKISLFVFGNNSQEKNSDLKTTEGFNFVFNSNSFDPSSSKSNTESKVVSSRGMGFGLNSNLFDIKEGMEPKLEDKAEAVFDSDNNNGNLSDTSNENTVKDEELNNPEQKQDENASNEEMMVMKTLVKEFKDVISSFVKERIEGERKIAALEGRIHTLEEEVQNLKSANSKESLSANVTNNNDTTKPMVNSVPQQQAQQSLELPTPVLISRQTPSPLVPSLAESSTLKKSVFGSTSSLFSCSSTPLFNGTSTNSFGSISSSLGNDTTASSNTVIGTSMFNPSVSTQTQAGSQLFGGSMQTSNLSSKNFALEQKQGNPKKLFTDQAVTTFLNAQKDPGMNNNSTKVNTGNPLKKMATGQECSEQNQNISTKEAFQANLQRTIEMTVKKFMEEFGKNFTCNASDDNFQKFNGNLF